MPTELPPDYHNATDRPQEAGLPVPRRTPALPDGNTLRIASLVGIPIRLHWTFFVLLIWLAFPGLVSGSQVHASWTRIVFVLGLFCCVALHELGHALVARRYGIRTRDIVLTPIGGLSRFESLPRPQQELWISLAGPAMNLALTLAFLVAARASGQAIGHFPFGGPGIGLTAALMWANFWLFAFNILPAFPMDGGRVLRSLLARNMDDLRATVLSARIGQGFALALGAWTLLSGNLLLLIVASFIFLGAGQEASAFATRSLAGGHNVREAMLREFHTLPVGMTLREAADLLLAGSQHDFPVMHGTEVVGILPRSNLLRGMAQQGPEAYVAGAMEREPTCVRPDVDLEIVLPLIHQSGPMLVLEEEETGPGRLVGILTQENLYEFLVLTRLQGYVH